MQVDAVGQAGERLCIPAPLNELPDLVAAGNLQRAGELPVDRVVDDDVDDRTAVVDDVLSSASICCGVCFTAIRRRRPRVSFGVT